MRLTQFARDLGEAAESVSTANSAGFIGKVLVPKRCERINCCNGSCTQEYKILDSSATRPTDPDDGSYWIAKDDVLGGIEAMQNHESNERLAFEQQIVEIQAEYKKTKYVGEKALQAAEKNQASAKSLSAIVFSPKYEAEFKLKRTLQTLQEQRRKMDVLNWIDSN